MSKSTKIADLIGEYEKKTGLNFRPSMLFFQKINIGRKAWKKLKSGEITPTKEQMQRIADFFGIELICNF